MIIVNFVRVTQMHVFVLYRWVLRFTFSQFFLISIFFFVPLQLIFTCPNDFKDVYSMLSPLCLELCYRQIIAMRELNQKVISYRQTLSWSAFIFWGHKK